MNREERLVIKCFHISSICEGEKNAYQNGLLTLNLNSLLSAAPVSSPLIRKAELRLAAPGQRHIRINTVMDILPVSVKALGSIGNGITHTFTGFYVLLTGADEDGIQIAEFGSSEGFLDEQVCFGRPGTPGENDWILIADLTLASKAGTTRKGPNAAHQYCETLLSPLRRLLKQLPGSLCTERHDYYNTRRPGKPTVVLIKQVAGQGAMYDTRLFAEEPSGFGGGRSIIDMGNMPVFITPNEYRDGAVRALY